VLPGFPSVNGAPNLGVQAEVLVHPHVEASVQDGKRFRLPRRVQRRTAAPENPEAAGFEPVRDLLGASSEW
jgi:hypothetical protein